MFLRLTSHTPNGTATLNALRALEAEKIGIFAQGTIGLGALKAFYAPK